MIAKGGRGFVAASAVATAVATPFYWYVAASFAALTLFFVFVFRDPSRKIGEGVVAPADGTVREIDHAKGFVSTYLALSNVHVTRAPMDGIVERKRRERGKHAPAFSEKTVHNERLEIQLATRLSSTWLTCVSWGARRRQKH